MIPVCTNHSIMKGDLLKNIIKLSAFKFFGILLNMTNSHLRGFSVWIHGIVLNTGKRDIVFRETLLWEMDFKHMVISISTN